jgi:transcriptional regulatory protein RtcR
MTFWPASMWTYELPGLAARTDDIEPNLDYEIEPCRRELNLHVTMSREARNSSTSPPPLTATPDATRTGNFRDLNAAVRRMATLCTGGRIALPEVSAEIERLRRAWRTGPADSSESRVDRALGPRAESLDRFDRVQLEEVLRVCEQASSARARSQAAA